MFGWNRSRSDLQAGIRSRRRRRARARRAAASKRAVLAALDPSEEGPVRPKPVARSGPAAPPVYGARGRRYQVVELGPGRFGVRVGRRVVSCHATAAEANRCIALMEENR
jgi:hypothetical protein